MSSTVPTVEAIRASFSDSPRNTDEPNFESISEMRGYINQGCMNVQSYDGGGNHGHLGLGLSGAEYIAQVPGHQYVRPTNPGAIAVIPDAATDLEAKIIMQEHAEQLRAYRLANNVDKACCIVILETCDDKYFAARADPIVRYANETAISLITHLKDCYAFISPIELVENHDRMSVAYDPSRPIEDLYKQIQDGRAYAQAGNQPYGRQQLVNMAYALIFNTGVYHEGCKEWEREDIMEKTWENFKIHFTAEHRLYRKQTQTAQASGYHAANHAQRAQEAAMSEQSEALALMATASVTDRGTMSSLITSNVQLSSSLAEKAEALATANETIRSLRSENRPSGGRARPSGGGASNVGSNRVRPVTDNDNYCWCHGYQIHVDHTSLTYTRRAGHQGQQHGRSPVGTRCCMMCRGSQGQR